MLNDIFDIRSSVAEILSGIEVIGMLYEVLADTCGASHSQIGVDVYLTYCHRSGLTKHIFGYADSVVKFTAVLVYDHNEFFR